MRRSAACTGIYRGFGLVEALGALAIGLFVVAAAITLHARAGAALRVLDAHARMHETARHVLAVIESDVRMAGYWGLAHTAENVSIHPLFAFPDRCGGAGWVTDVERFVDGTNNQYLGVTNCAALSGGAQGWFRRAHRAPGQRATNRAEQPRRAGLGTRRSAVGFDPRVGPAVHSRRYRRRDSSRLPGGACSRHGSTF